MRFFLSTLTMLLLVPPPSGLSEEGQSDSGQSDPRQPLGLFDAQASGEVNVRFIALNSKAANVLIRNEGDQPIDVQLPRIFGARPVLAQVGQIGAQQIGLQGFGQQGGQNGGSQQVGGAFGQQGGRQNGFGQIGGKQIGGNQIGGMMRIEAHKTRKVSVATVCLEHGKPDPHPKSAYEMVPLERLTTDETIAEALVALGQGEISQSTAQAIAWHQANGLSWSKLAELDRSTSRYRPAVKLFGKRDLSDAKSFVLISSGHHPDSVTTSGSTDSL